MHGLPQLFRLEIGCLYPGGISFLTAQLNEWDDPNRPEYILGKVLSGVPNEHIDDAVSKLGGTLLSNCPVNSRGLIL